MRAAVTTVLVLTVVVLTAFGAAFILSREDVQAARDLRPKPNKYTVTAPLQEANNRCRTHTRPRSATPSRATKTTRSRSCDHNRGRDERQ